MSAELSRSNGPTTGRPRSPSRGRAKWGVRVPVSALLLALLGVLLAACGSPAPKPTAVQPANVSFAVSEDLFGQAIVAEQKGYFAAHKITATVTNYSTGVGTLEAALTGRADFAAALAFPTLTYLKSHQLVIVSADMHPAPGFYSLAVRRPITYPGGLKNATFGLETGTDQVYQTSALLKNFGLSLTKVKTVQFSDLFGIVSALRAGDINAALVYETGIPESRAIPGVTIYPDTLKTGIEPAYIVVSRAFLSHHESVVVRCLQALREANSWMLANMKAASVLVGKYVGAPPSVLYPDMKGENYTVSWSSSDLSSFESIAKVLLEEHLTTTIPTPAGNIDTVPITAATK